MTSIKKQKDDQWQLVTIALYTLGLFVGLFIDKTNLILVCGFLLVTATIVRLIKHSKEDTK